MRLHWKKGSKMHKDGRHSRKYAMLVNPALAEEARPCGGRKKTKHSKHAMRKGSMLAPGHRHGKWWKHCKGMLRGRSSSSSSDSDDEHRHDKGKHGKGGRHHGKGKHFRVLRGFSTTSNSDDEGIAVMEDNVLRRGRKPDATTTDLEAGGRRGRGRHFGVMRGRSMSHSDDEEMPRRRCMSDVEGGRHGGRRRMRFGGMGGHRGRGEHRRGWRMSDSDDDDHHRHSKGRHMQGMMMHHHEWKRGMKGHGRRRFFDEDEGVLVPIYATQVEEDHPETTSDKGNTGNPTTGTSEEAAGGGARTREQGTQTTGILEIVIEDQEALTAAIRIVNKFL